MSRATRRAVARRRRRDDGALIGDLIPNMPRAIDPHPGEPHTWGAWGSWRPPVITPRILVTVYHVTRRCRRCDAPDTRWLTTEPDGRRLAGVDQGRPLPIAEYLELVGVTLPDPSTLPEEEPPDEA